MKQVGPEQTGKPPRAGVYVVRFWLSRRETFAYCDGKRWSRPQPDGWTAGTMAHRVIEGRLPLSQRARLPVSYWRTYSSDGRELVDAWRGAK